MDTKQKLKSLWKKLGINGQVVNFSSRTLWVLETNTGKSIVYDPSKSWGVPIKLVTDIRRNKKGKITKYLVSEIGWVSAEEALSLTCQREIDNARPVFPSGGSPYIRTRRDRELFNNLEVRG